MLTISYAFIYGIGQALGFVLAVTLAVKWFYKSRRGLAAGLTAGGYSLGTLGHEVIVAGVQRDEEFGRLKIAERFEAYRVVNLDKEDFSRVAMEMRGKGFYKDKEGFDVVVVASPSPQAVDLALRTIRPGGKIIQIGHPHSREPISITYYNVLDDVTIYGTSVSTRDYWERSLALMASGKLRFAPEAITKYSLDEWEEAFKDFWEGKVIRSIIIP